MNKNKKRDQKASEKKTYTEANHLKKAVAKNGAVNGEKRPIERKKDSKNSKTGKTGAPILNRRQKQKVSDLIKQLRVSAFRRANSVSVRSITAVC